MVVLFRRAAAGVERTKNFVVDDDTFWLLLNLVDNRGHFFISGREVQFGESMGDGATAAVTSEDQLNVSTPHYFRSKRQIGVWILEQSVLMDAGFSGKYVRSTNRLHP